MGDYLSDMAKKQPDIEAVVYHYEGVRLTYKELDEATDKIAKGLIQIGIKKGDHVSMWAPNVPEWILLLFATAKMGAVLVTVNTLYRSAELEYLLRQSDTTTLVLVNGYKGIDYVETLHDVLPELKEHPEEKEINSDKLPMLKKIIFVGENKPNGTMSFDDLYLLGQNVSDEHLETVKKGLDRHDIINMQYTSGTTGFPKGVMLSHFNILNNAYAIGQCMNFTNQDRLCIPVPFFHCFGLVLSILVCLTHGSTMVPVESFNPVHVLETIDKEKCTAVHGVPTMFISMLQTLDGKDYDISHLRTGIMAGSPCPVDTMKSVIEKMNMSEITIVYGQTEASPGMTQTRATDPIEKRVETVGTELPGAEIKIVDPETGEDCPANVSGELWGRGYNVMRGYYKMEEATKAAFTHDGWLKTGDLALKTEDGYYKITGRIKDMIIRGGENIYPREIEEYLYGHPEIEDVQVVGIPDKKYGEEVMAFIKLRNKKNTHLTDDIKLFCKGKIADYKIPKHIHFVEEFPMTASGKIQKFKLRDIGTEIVSEI